MPHVLLLATQGVQRKISIKPPPRIRAIMARIVHTVEAEVTRADNSLLAAGKSTTSSVPRPNLLALPSKNLRRRDAFSQDILAAPPILFPIVLSKTFSKLCSQRYLSLRFGRRFKVFLNHLLHVLVFPLSLKNKSFFIVLGKGGRGGRGWIFSSKFHAERFPAVNYYLRENYYLISVAFPRRKTGPFQALLYFN